MWVRLPRPVLSQALLLPRRCAHSHHHRSVDSVGVAHAPAAFSGSLGSRRAFWFSRSSSKLLGIEGLAKPHDFPRLAEDAVKEARRELDGVAGRGPLELVHSLDTASNSLCRVADAAELIRNVHPDQAWVASATEAVQAIAGYMGEVNLDLEMYNGMCRAEASDEFPTLPLEERMVLKHMRVSMEHEGIHLEAAEKANCLQLLEHEQELSFSIVQRGEFLRRGDAASGSVWIATESVREALGDRIKSLPTRRVEQEEVLVPSDNMWVQTVLQYAVSPEARQKVYKASQEPDNQGEQNMAQLQQVRQSLAQLRGYRTWSEYAMREAILEHPDRVKRFLVGAWERLLPGLRGDLEILAAEKEQLGLGTPVLEPWDLPFLLHRCKENRSPTQNREISEYLTYSGLMRGVDHILSKLLGLSFVAETPESGEVWHPSVQKYTVREKDKILGIMYLDPFSRPGKAIQSAQFTLQGSKRLDGGEQTPMTCLVFALPPAANMGLPVSYAVTFMHEIGHALHSLLSETTMQHLSGTRGTVDFVEFPSHLFEHFVLDPSCLTAYATHHKNGSPMPKELKEAYRVGRAKLSHIDATQHLMYAAMDQAFYSYVPPPGAEPDVSALHQHMSEALAPFEFSGPFNGSFIDLLGLSKPSKFDHLVHYGGSYYCYLYNRALSAHVWRQGFEADPFSAESGSRLREFFRRGSVVQSLGAIEALCGSSPGSTGFSAESVPLDAFVDELTGGKPKAASAALGGA